jgi:hypothetical protein
MKRRASAAIASIVLLAGIGAVTVIRYSHREQTAMPSGPSIPDEMVNAAFFQRFVLHGSLQFHFRLRQPAFGMPALAGGFNLFRRRLAVFAAISRVPTGGTVAVNVGAGFGHFGHGGFLGVAQSRRQ